jgi:hypothetical protein
MMPDSASSGLHLWLDGGRQKLNKDFDIRPLNSGSPSRTMTNGQDSF